MQKLWDKCARKIRSVELNNDGRTAQADLLEPLPVYGNSSIMHS